MFRLTQAMILGAGFSTRLRPLTEETPKPLLPFLDETLFDYSLHFLRHHGIRSVAVNVHFGRPLFLEALRRYRGVRPFVEDTILGTGGGIKNMAPFVKEDCFVVLNCDTFSDVDLEAAAAFHLQHGALATMILTPHPRAKDYGEIGIGSDGQIVRFPHGRSPGGEKQRGIFSGIHIFSREIFRHMPSEPVFCINREVYAPLIEKGLPLFGYLSEKPWVDAGETALYFRSQFELLRSPFSWMRPILQKLASASPGISLAPRVRMPPDAKAKPPLLVCAGARIGRKAQLGPNVIVGANAEIGEDSCLENTIVFPRTSVPAGVTHANVFLRPAGVPVPVD